MKERVSRGFVHAYQVAYPGPNTGGQTHDGLYTGSEITLHQEIAIPLLDNSLKVAERLVMQLSVAKTISIHSHPWGDFATSTNC